jgi:hypothetical protein
MRDPYHRQVYAQMIHEGLRTLKKASKGSKVINFFQFQHHHTPRQKVTARQARPRHSELFRHIVDIL